jgi:hypothetical protein
MLLLIGIAAGLTIVDRVDIGELVPREIRGDFAFSGEGERFFQILAGPNNGSAHRYATQYRQ